MAEMTRADICSSDDDEAIERLQRAFSEIGLVADDSWHESSLGVGLQTFRRGTEELTVFRDAWIVDVFGGEALVNALMVALQDP